jgi:hypothetical protein
VFLWNFATNKIEKRIYDITKIQNLKIRFKKLFNSINKKYFDLRSEYKNSFEFFKTEEFWEKYLEIQKS